MALQLKYDLPTGTSGDYWRITQTTIDIARKLVYVRLSLYLDAAARQAEKDALTMLMVAVDAEPVIAVVKKGGELLATAYELLKKQPALKAATDC